MPTSVTEEPRAAQRADLLARLIDAESTRSTTILLASHGARLAMGFVASVLLARGLGAAGYGVTTVVAAAFAVAQTLADGGLRLGALRLLSQLRTAAPIDAARLARGYLAATVALNLVVLAGGLLAADLVATYLLRRPALAAPLALILAGLLPAAIGGALTTMLQATRRFTPLAWSQVVGAAVNLVGILVLAGTGSLSVTTVILVGLLTPVVSAAVSWRAVPSAWRTPAGDFGPAGRAAIARVLPFGKWMWLSTLLSLIAAQLDLFVASRWLSPSAAGVYALAFNLTARVDVLSYTRTMVRTPRVAALESAHEMRSYIRRTFGRGLALAAVLFVPLALFAEPAVRMFYGAEFAPAVPVLLILLAASLVDFVAGPLLALAFPLADSRTIAAGDGVRLAVMLAGVLLLVPGFGMTGAAAAKLLSRFGGAVFVWWRLRSRIRILESGNSTAAAASVARCRWLFAGIVPAIALFVGAGLVAWHGRFDGLWGQDPFAYFAYAVGPLRENIRHGIVPPFFWPPGYPLVVAAAASALSPDPLAAQIVSLAAGASIPLLTAWLAAEVMSTGREMPATATLLVAAATAALTPQLWQWSVFIMADTTALAAATCAFAAVLRYRRVGDLRWLALAAATMAWAVLTRWAYAILAIPCLVAALGALSQRPAGVALRHGSVATLLVLAILAPVIPSVALHVAGRATTETAFIGDLQVIGWDARNAVRREWTDIDGRVQARLWNGLYYATVPARWFFFTPLIVPFLAAGLSAMLRRRDGEAALLVSWPLLTLVLIAGMAGQNPRFALPLVPPLAVLTGVGFHAIASRSTAAVRRLATVGLVAAFAWMAAGAVRLTSQFAVRKADHLATVRWAQEQVPGNARLLTFSLTHTFQYYAALETIELFALAPHDIDAMRREDRPLFLLLDVAAVERQWQGRSPWVNFRHLRDNGCLTLMASRGELTLFRVAAAR